MLPGARSVLMQRLFLFSLFFFSLYGHGHAEDTVFLKVHFLYGSKPLYKYRSIERRWFGGVLGGHVGIEGDSGRIINFGPQGKFHVFAQNNRHSRYRVHSETDFYAILGSNPDSVKKAVIYIPVTQQQLKRFDSIAACYLTRTPYDYAFFGMRCGAAAYDILGQLALLPAYSSHTSTFWNIFYPKKLRKRLLRLAIKYNWRVERQTGSYRRVWEAEKL